MNELFAIRLKKLREEAGLTQEELGEAVGLSSEYISLLEAGKRTPSIIALNRISRYFQKNVSYFLETRENPFQLLLSEEKLDTATKEIIRKFQAFCEEYSELERLTDRQCQLAPLYAGSLSPQNMAEEERRRLGLGNEPIRDIFNLVEVNGCHLLRLKFPESAHLSGVFIFLEEKNSAFALVNAGLPVGQQIIATAHLYGHYLRDRFDSPILDNPDVLVDEYVTLYSPREQFAQAFAMRFLIPPSKVRELVEREVRSRHLTYPQVIFLKRYFGVSTPAMLRTLRLMNYLSRSQFENYFKLNHEQEEKAIFGHVSVEERETSPPGPEMILPERYFLLKKEAEIIKQTAEEEQKSGKTESDSPSGSRESGGQETEEN